MRIAQYEVERELGRGGMGIVYLARDPHIDRSVVLKVLTSGRIATEAQRERLRREGEALARLRHPAVVRVFGVEALEDGPVLVLEYVAGETLQEHLDRLGPWPCRAAAELLLSLTQAVTHAHEEGVLHRDLKPDNVLLDEDGTPRLSEFGLAHLGEHAGQRLTETGHAMGTPGFWPPEQARGRRDAIGPASDVFGLGGILHALLTGRPPVQGETLVEVLSGLKQPQTPPSAERVDVDPVLERICLACLEREPEARPTTEELEGALETYLRGEGGSRAPALVVAVGALVLLAGLLVVLATRPGGSLPPGSLAMVRSASKPAPSTASSKHPTPSADALWSQALEAAKRKDYAEALRALRALAEVQPNRPGLHLLRGQARLEEGNIAGGLDDFERVLQEAPNEVSALVGRSAAHWKQGSKQAAWADVQRAITLGPRYAPAYERRAVMRVFAGRDRAAIVDATTALKLNPRSVDALYLRGLARYRLNQLAQAEQDLTDCIALAPRDVRGWIGRGQVRTDLPSLKGAVDDFDVADRLAPGRADILSRRGKAKFLQSNFSGALVDYDRALVLAPRSGPAYLGRALIHHASQDFTAAARDFEQAFRYGPKAMEKLGRGAGKNFRSYIEQHLGRPSRW